jgi:hypothetical protein
VVSFFTAHRGDPVPSPALMQQMGNRFRRDVRSFADEHDLPLLRLSKPDRTRWDDRKLDHVRPHLEQAAAHGRFGSHLLMIERAGQGCAIGSALFERIHQPYIREGQRTGALRFGGPRAMALTGALCVFVHAVAGFTNKSLRGLVAGLLGSDYTTAQMTYDLRRLRLHGLI